MKKRSLTEAEKKIGFVEVDEKTRRYVYGCHTLDLKNVAAIAVRPSGNHRVIVEPDNGPELHYIVAPGWLWIELDNNGRPWDF